MSETKFTQGPWRHKAESNLGGQVVGIDPARHNGERSVASVHAVDGSAEEHRANIALISSAPELYEALDAITSYAESALAQFSNGRGTLDISGFHSLIKASRAALSAAREGE